VIPDDGRFLPALDADDPKLVEVAVAGARDERERLAAATSAMPFLGVPGRPGRQVLEESPPAVEAQVAGQALLLVPVEDLAFVRDSGVGMRVEDRSDEAVAAAGIAGEKAERLDPLPHGAAA